MIYVDASAMLKGVFSEERSHEVRTLLTQSPALVSSRLLAVELHAVAKRRRIPESRIEAVLDLVDLVSLDDDVTDRAIALRSGLRALDALHLATALHLGDAVSTFLGFDEELNRAAKAQGLVLHSP